MRRRKSTYKAIAKAKAKSELLDNYNAKSYVSDLEYIGGLHCAEGKKEWIECTMYVLRSKANIYETNMAEFLIKKKVRFIHQAPFVFYGTKIYFADFYLPEMRLIIEVDGTYHNGDRQFAYDKERDENFKSIKVNTIRIPNDMTIDTKRLTLRLSEYIQ